MIILTASFQALGGLQRRRRGASATARPLQSAPRPSMPSPAWPRLVLSTAGPNDADRTAVFPTSSRVSEAAEPLEIGPDSTLVDDRYRIVSRLGSGARGIVYEAEDVLLKRPAALKVLEPVLARSESAGEELLREARAVAKLRHDNVVQIYAFGRHDTAKGSLLFFAMEYVDGEGLDSLIHRHSVEGAHVPIERALHILRGVASGLTAAHALHVVHRDVKPSNIVLESVTDRPVLVDFGLARELAPSSPRSSMVFAGTPSYVAPEQAKNDRERVGPRSDLYSLACTAFELFTGRVPFEGKNTLDILRAHITDEPPWVSSFRPEHRCFDEIIARGLAKDPDLRFASCIELVAALEEAAREARLIGAESQPPTSALVTSRPRVLVLGTDDGIRRAVVREAVKPRTGRIEATADIAALLEAQAYAPAELIVIDDDAADGRALELARRLREDGAEARIVVLTGALEIDRSEWEAVDTIRIAKPLNLRSVATTLEAARRR